MLGDAAVTSAQICPQENGLEAPLTRSYLDTCSCHLVRPRYRPLCPGNLCR